MNKSDTKKIVKKKFNLLRTIVFLLIMYLIYESGKYLYNLPIKNIQIIGNNYVSDKEIIFAAGIQNYPAIIRLNSTSIIKKIKKIELINEVKIIKKWGSILEINVTENIPLFYKDDKIILSNNKKINAISKYVGLPTLINYVPEEILSDFVKSFTKISISVKDMINTIEYIPQTNENNEMVESDRFVLTMSDSNIVYIVPSQMTNLNYYLGMLSSLADKKGYIYLDSGNYDNFVFKQFGE